MNVEEYLRQELNAKEKEELDRFLEHVQNHWSDYMAKKQLNVMGRVPGGVDASDSTYRITPSSIGTVYVCICNVCKKEFNITDFSCW